MTSIIQVLLGEFIFISKHKSYITHFISCKSTALFKHIFYFLSSSPHSLRFRFYSWVTKMIHKQKCIHKLPKLYRHIANANYNCGFFCCCTIETLFFGWQTAFLISAIVCVIPGGRGRQRPRVDSRIRSMKWNTDHSAGLACCILENTHKAITREPLRNKHTRWKERSRVVSSFRSINRGIGVDK